MQVILLERVGRLGQMGDVVRVRDGYARNFLLPQGKALRANESNLARFEHERAQLEARNLERRAEAQAVAERMAGRLVIVIRAAGQTGQLYGSVTTRDVAETLGADGISIERGQVNLHAPIKTIGMHNVEIRLHPEVSETITVNVARSPEEAERQARGEDLSVRDTDRFAFEPGEEAEETEETAASEVLDLEVTDPPPAEKPEETPRG